MIATDDPRDHDHQPRPTFEVWCAVGVWSLYHNRRATHRSRDPARIIRQAALAATAEAEKTGREVRTVYHDPDGFTRTTVVRRAATEVEA